MRLQSAHFTISLTEAQEKTILALIINKEGMTPPELSRLYKGNDCHRATFNLAGDYLTELRFRFDETSKSYTLFKRKSCGGSINKRWKYILDMETLFLFFIEYYKLNEHNNMNDVKSLWLDRINTSLYGITQSSWKRRLAKVVNGGLDAYNLQSVFYEWYDIVQTPALKEEKEMKKLEKDMSKRQKALTKAGVDRTHIEACNKFNGFD